MRQRFSLNLAERLTRSATVLLLIALTILSITPLFAPGYFYAAHDGRHSVFYLIQFDASIRDWALWPRWAMHHTQGYGYPTFIIQAPIGFYLAEIFILLGAGYTLAAKFSWAIGSFVAGWGIYKLVSHWLWRYGNHKDRDIADVQAPSVSAKNLEQPNGRQPLIISTISLVAAIIYVFIPYHLLGMYVRAALNDTLLLAWFPWVVLAFDRLIDHSWAEDNADPSSSSWPRRLAIAAFTLGGVLLTHTFALISFAPLLISFVLFRLGLKYRLTSNWRDTIAATVLAAGAGIGALLLYANFLLPLLVEGSQHLQEQVYVANTYDFHQHFVYWGQFFNPFWGFGFSDDPQGAMDGMSFQVGALALLIAGAALYLHVEGLSSGGGGSGGVSSEGGSSRDVSSQGIFATQASSQELDSKGVGSRKVRSALGPFSIYLLIMSLAVLVVMTPVATPLWESTSLLAVIQFPWRLLSLTAFTLSTLAGITLFRLCQRWYPSAFSYASARSEADQGQPPDTRYAKQATAGIVMIALLAIFGSYSFINANLEPIEAWREDGRAIVFFEREHPEMMGYTEWVEGIITESPMTPNYLDEGYREDYSNNGKLDRLVILANTSGETVGEVVSRYSRGSSMGGVVRLDESATVRILVYHFPGWQVTVDDIPVEHVISKPAGLIEVEVPAGEHRIDARFQATPVRRIGTAISWATALLFLVMLFNPQKWVAKLTNSLRLR